jgi:hypothetical protein
MRSRKILTALAASGAFALITAGVPGAFAQGGGPGPSGNSVTAPNNDAGSC